MLKKRKLPEAVKNEDGNAEAAAKMTNCSYTKHWVSKSRPGIPNHTISNLVFESLKQVGPPKWGKDAKKFADACGFVCIAGRFTPGRLTNPEMRFFIEPKVIVLTDIAPIATMSGLFSFCIATLNWPDAKPVKILRQFYDLTLKSERPKSKAQIYKIVS